MRAALLQLTSSDEPQENLAVVRAMMRDAADRGAELIATPEVTNCISLSRSHQADVLKPQADDPVLSGLRQEADALGVWLLIGSLALQGDGAEGDGRFANRSFLIDPDGQIAAWYDKIHMFDVQLNENETFRESDGYRPGDRAVMAQTPWGGLGMTVCYDIRFAHLYRDLAQAGARILTVPAAFSPVTGIAHWHTLLRARAIETGCFVLAPAQCGTHKASQGRPRQTYGHSLVVAPWGEVLADAGEEPGITMVDLDMASVDDARGKVPSLTHDRSYRGP